MFNEYSPMAMAEPTFMQLGPPGEPPADISPKKLIRLLKKFNFFPDQHRKMVWSYVLKLPNNVKEAQSFKSKPTLPNVKTLCDNQHVSQAAFRLTNALVHWHTPLINCDWLPQMAQKLTNAFPNSFTFCFEVVIILLTNAFGEWMTQIPGPPPEVLSRIDTIFATEFPSLRDSLGTSLVAWPAYRSIFSTSLYDRPWIQLMDFILLSEPQFLEFAVIAWLGMNETQLHEDHETFNIAPRPVAVPILVENAIKLYNKSPPAFHVYRTFKYLNDKFYPTIEGSSDAVVLCTLQSDQERLLALQKQLEVERKQADDAELAKTRKEQTYRSIEAMHEKKKQEEKLATSRASVELEKRMQQIRLESVRLKQAEELQFIEQWENEWEKRMDFSHSNLSSKLNNSMGLNKEEEDDNKLTSMASMRDGDLLLRESRRVSISRGKHARSEIESQVHQRAVHNEVNKLAMNPEMLMLGQK
ncbi:hypothetical protein TVAG_377840 [Trichomonas vaginalis G3]|uniref:Rab-GAP TBC domain-containing protein n=1 Tax=Trichomonas vaginalis (strain ATCC PRA-98 / G3) TaxID=412133 RepID=A2DAX5_TRIV3|nr:regulation of vesicle fusion [Trichomonas vaginalis G3]EAY22305.1 hypothetical protein TVAG_377840 [Trichomonas vaginalis G3]KAI5518243.1 regulation of vesicle fusion [Trichomonas vaginalis G3]|eukprot:XP_001583291.1 hypothetical protein [Trichomonas vaginalis G3]